MRRGFTLVELISSIAILALITVTLVVTIPNFINWARETADKQTLAVLNDALNRYKTQGGDVNALTTGTPIAHVISKLQTAVTWAGKGHEFLSGGRTFVGRSIDALGEQHQYRFTRYDHYEQEAGGSSPVSMAGQEPNFGEAEVGYIEVADSNGITLWVNSTSGFWAMKVESSAPTTYTNGSWVENIPGEYAIFWPCESLNDISPSGHIIEVNCASGYSNTSSNTNVSAIQVNMLSDLTSLIVMENQIGALDLTGLASLSMLYCASNQLGLIDTTGCVSLPPPCLDYSTEFQIRFNPSVTVTGQWTYP